MYNAPIQIEILGEKGKINIRGFEVTIEAGGTNTQRFYDGFGALVYEKHLISSYTKNTKKAYHVRLSHMRYANL